MEVSKKSMRICYNAGSDDAGKQIIRKQTYSGIIPSSTNEKIKEAATAIASVCARNMMYVELVTTTRI